MKGIVVKRLKDLIISKDEDKLLMCLHKIQLSYNKLTEWSVSHHLALIHLYVCMYACMYVCMYVCSFVENLLFLLPNFHGVFRSMCLEVLLSQADIRKDLYLELKDKGFGDMLTHRYYVCMWVKTAYVAKHLNLSLK